MANIGGGGREKDLGSKYIYFIYNKFKGSVGSGLDTPPASALDLPL